MQVRIETVDYTNPLHADAFVSLLDIYASGKSGGGRPLSDSVRAALPAALASVPGAFSLLAFDEQLPVGLANCFMGFSTFACRPLVNIHDLMVIPEYRGRGISQDLMAGVESIARDRGCCKITLEVLEGNHAAVTAYHRYGFNSYELDPVMGKAMFMEKSFD
jgi:ribosomal protein S18 acetylase RimI-like enzyme